MSFSHIDESKESVLEKCYNKEHVVSDTPNNGQIKHKFGSNSPKKKDVIDEGIERIQEKLKKMKNQHKTSDSEVERKRRFQERMRKFTSLESNVT